MNKTKEYWLALGWGSAKWFVHIWVISVLLKNNILIKEVSWTSMWAIIAAAFALEYTPSEMLDFLDEISFLKLADLSLWEWLIKWNKILKVLDKFYKNKNIEDLKIPLKIIATDINSWEKIVFTKWNIANAVRSSISLPWVFYPYKHNDLFLVDWWASENLPISVLDSNNIIAVSVMLGSILPIKESKTILWIKFNGLFTKYEIIQQYFRIINISNENNSIKQAKSLWKNVNLILPDLNKFSYSDFSKYKDIIKVWENIEI